MLPRSVKDNLFRSPASDIRPLNLNWSIFMESIAEDEEIVNNNNINVNVIEEDFDSIEGVLWKEVRQNKKATNFTELLDIWYDMQPHIEEQEA